MYNFLLGLTFSFLISFGAYKKESLTLSGFISSLLLGSFLYYFGGMFFFIIMISFFLSSTLLTKYKKSLKKSMDDINEKGGKRDHTQVIANAVVAFIFALLYHETNNTMYLLAFATSMASSNSDTWASEIGVLSKYSPVSIKNFKPVNKGESGGITVLGITFSFLGSLFISIIFYVGYLLLYKTTKNALLLLFLCTLGGFLGSIIDSYLGALIQGKFICNQCGKYTEKKLHHGKPTKHIGGIKIFDNNLVNFTSGLLSTIVTIFIYSLIR